jgi:hypothetical protein
LIEFAISCLLMTLTDSLDSQFVEQYTKCMGVVSTRKLACRPGVSSLPT